jgi:DNA-binding NtrC family response regulator
VGITRVPARIVLVHDDEEFAIAATIALRNAGYDVATFTDSALALDALLSAKSVELLVTRMQFGPRKPAGGALARMTMMKRSELKVVFTALPQYAQYVEGLGPFLPMPVDLGELVGIVRRLLASES